MVPFTKQRLGEYIDVDVASTVAQRDYKDATDLVASFAENQRAEVLESSYVRSLAVGGGKPRQGFPAARVGTQVRRLTPLECERLQGFPDNWTDTPGNSDTQRYRQMGNAVAVPVVEWILSRIANVENTHE